MNHVIDFRCSLMRDFQKLARHVENDMSQPEALPRFRAAMIYLSWDDYTA